MLHQHAATPVSPPKVEASSADNGIDLSEVPNAPRRRNGALLQVSDIAATLALAAHGPAKNGSAPVSEPSPASATKLFASPPPPALPASAPGLVSPPSPRAAELPGLAQAPVVAASAATPAPPDASYLAAALQTQYLQHQLALAEQRNQHLLEQQALLQQMVQLLQRPA